MRCDSANFNLTLWITSSAETVESHLAPYGQEKGALSTGAVVKDTQGMQENRGLKLNVLLPQTNSRGSEKLKTEKVGTLK